MRRLTILPGSWEFAIVVAGLASAIGAVAFALMNDGLGALILLMIALTALIVARRGIQIEDDVIVIRGFFSWRRLPLMEVSDVGFHRVELPTGSLQVLEIVDSDGNRHRCYPVIMAGGWKTPADNIASEIRSLIEARG